MENGLRNKIIRNVAVAVLAIIGVNVLVLAFLGFPLMAKLQFQKYWPLLILLVGGFGTQVGLYTYSRHLNAVCSFTTAASGGVSTFSMLLCCSHYLINVVPFISLSFASWLTRYTFYILLFGIVSNAFGIWIVLKKISEHKKIHGDACGGKKDEVK
ncbi:hypothetical protein J4207_05740 [Candidatus Woesearchaeota archaeon]|nr:hypothetical protein [Candidatus Woesearchaeota archaeon]HLC80491.1 hypothetical protein [Candidatus Nanoarchaeia archaeon]